MGGVTSPPAMECMARSSHDSRFTAMLYRRSTVSLSGARPSEVEDARIFGSRNRNGLAGRLASVSWRIDCGEREMIECGARGMTELGRSWK